jgi:hypothetical protein
MEINDLLPADSDKKQLGYDLKDDLVCFMQNDPQFYRKEYFPVMHKFKEYVESGKSVHPRAFEGLVKKAYESYQSTFKVEGLESTLEKDMCEGICNTLHEQETKNVEDGRYDEN